MSEATSKAYTPGLINKLKLRNRFIKTATYEGMTPGGVPSPALTAHHVELARGGVGMTTVAYCAVSPDGRTFGDQLVLSDEAMPHLRALTDQVREAGAAVSLQLGHCGGFSKNKGLERGPLGPSRAWNPYGITSGLFRTVAMTEEDIAETTTDFANAALRAKTTGFDAIELHVGHGYLLSQWLSPAVNKRTDRHGGSLENRLRFPLNVVKAVREAVGPNYPLLAKTNLRDGIPGGLGIEESAEIAVALAENGIDALVMSGGLVSRNAFFLLRGGRPLKEMIAVDKSMLQKVTLALAGPLLVRKVPFTEMFFLEDALRIRQAVTIPLVLLGGITSLANVETAMDRGFDFVAMGRALIADPNLVNEMKAGQKAQTRCVQCNKCITEMDRVGVRCVLDDVVPAPK